MSRVGIMGGTFNPVHLAHLAIAHGAYRQAYLDKVIFMPTGNPPHKSSEDIISGEHRCEMIKLAIKDIPYFEFSDLEFQREGKIYSAQTLEIFHEMNPEDLLFFIMGADSLFSIESWYMPQKVMEIADIICIGRDGVSDENLERQADLLLDKYNARVQFVNIPQMDISSSDIRNGIRESRDMGRYLPAEVWEYIKRTGCYTICD